MYSFSDRDLGFRPLVGFLPVVWSRTSVLCGQIRGGLGFSCFLLQLRWSEGKLDKEATVSVNKALSSAELSLLKQALFPPPIGHGGRRKRGDVLGGLVVLWPTAEARGDS
jgi:hypothetical protein